MVEKEKDIDVVKDLRDRADAFFLGTCSHFYEDDAELDRRAADEIERLRAALRHILSTNDGDTLSYESVMVTAKAALGQEWTGMHQDLKNILQRIAIDIQEHREWSYIKIAAHIASTLANDSWVIQRPIKE